MRAGRLRHRGVIEKRGEVQDPDSGAMVPGWEPVATVWMGVEPLSARAFIAAQAAQSKVTGQIVIRYREGIDASMRIRHKGRVYNIEGVLPDDRSGREHLTLPYSEGVNDG